MNESLLREAALELVRQAEMSLDYRPAFRRAIADVVRLTARFEMTYCSQCGNEQGPGDEGFSNCSDHRYKNLRAIAKQEK